MTAAMALARYVHFISIMAAFGAGAYLLILKRCLPHGIRAPNFPSAFFPIAAGLALASVIASLPITVSEMSGGSSSAIEPSALWIVLSQTRFGKSFLASLVLLIGLLLIGAHTPRNHLILCTLAGLDLVAVAMTSHAAAVATDRPLLILRTLGDALHLLAGGFWLGGLLVLATTLRSGPKDSLMPQLGLFSLCGTYAVAFVVASGLVNAAAILPRADVLWRDPYGELLSFKIVLVVAMLGLAAINRWCIVPAARGTGKKTGSLKRNVAVEIALALVVIGIAADLGVSAP